MTADLGGGVARGATIDWVDNAAYVLVGDEAKTRLVRTRIDGAAERTFEAQGDDRAILAFDVADDSSTAALVFSPPQTGADAHAVAVDDLEANEDPESLRQLSAVNAELTDSYPMPAVRRVEWESDGWTIDGIVYHDPAIDLGTVRIRRSSRSTAVRCLTTSRCSASPTQR